MFSIIQIKLYSQCLGFGGIIINFLLYKTINVVTVDSEFEDILWLRLIINLHFCEGRQTAEGNGKRKELVSSVSLPDRNDMLANCQLRKF